MKHWIVALPLYSAALAAQPLSLPEALRMGDAHSPRLAAQRHAITSASEQTAAAGRLPDPRLRFGIENLLVSGPDKFRDDREPMTQKALGVMQEFPNSAKRAARSQRAARAQDVERANLTSQRAILHRDIAAAWLELHYAERGRQALERLIATLSTQSDLAATALARGRLSAAESLMLRGALEQARERLLEQDRLIARARINLAVLIGETDRPLAAPPDVSRLEPSRDVLLKRITDHAHLRVFDVRETLARADLDVARAGRRPDWGLEVTYGQRSPYFDNMLSVMVSVDLPWQRARVQDREIAAKLAEVEQSRAMREDARRMHAAEMRGFLADYDAATARIERYLKVLIPLARERYEAAFAAYRGGRGELNAVLEASRGVADTELALVAIDAERAKAWANLTYLYTQEDEHDAHGMEVKP